jgi:hypothetical protein
LQRTKICIRFRNERSSHITSRLIQRNRPRPGDWHWRKHYGQWCREIFANLNTAHPDLEKHTSHLDVWLWGHAMVRPVPGFIWGDAREKMSQPMGNLVFAHSDMSGISIFEEAYIRGDRAADSLLQRLGHSASKV